MQRWILILAFVLLPSGILRAQNIAGTWQGTLKAGPQELRVVMKFSLQDDKLKGEFYSIDQKTPAIPASAITRDGANLKIAVAALAGSYEGRISTDGNTITGTWAQGPMPLPLNLVRATPETAWAIPEPPPPPRMMKADANPAFEVATIKPSKPDAVGSRLTLDVSNILTVGNMSLSGLLTFAFGIHARQVSGGPAWMETEKYDITAKPDTAGQPSDKQLRSMMQKLLVERFQLKFHRDKKELSVYAITVGKNGAKLTKTENNPNGLPGFGFRGPGDLIARNATMTDFAGLLQGNVVERPVVDQTALPTRYDFELKWTPDGGGRGGQPPPSDTADAPPDLFTAFQ